MKHLVDSKSSLLNIIRENKEFNKLGEFDFQNGWFDFNQELQKEKSWEVEKTKLMTKIGLKIKATAFFLTISIISFVTGMIFQSIENVSNIVGMISLTLGSGLFLFIWGDLYIWYKESRYYGNDGNVSLRF